MTTLPPPVGSPYPPPPPGGDPVLRRWSTGLFRTWGWLGLLAYRLVQLFILGIAAFGAYETSLGHEDLAWPFYLVAVVLFLALQSLVHIAQRK